MRKILSLFAAVLFVSSMMAESITITPSNFKSSYQSSETTFTIGEVEFAYNGAMYNGKNSPTGFGGKQLIQLRKSANGAGEIKNNDALNLKSIVIATQNDKDFSLSVGTAANALNAAGDPVKTSGKYACKDNNDGDKEVDVAIYTFNVEGNNYFDFLNGATAQYIAYITIELGSGEGPAVVAPSISGTTPFLSTTTVTLACSTADAAIYYTLDGTDPTSTSTLYENPFVLNASATVKAIAVKDADVSNIVSKEFTKIDVLTVTQANAALAESSPLSDKYVHGIISQIDSYSSQYNSITYWISDDGTTTGQLEVYSGKGLNGANFSSLSDLQLGDIVTVHGDLKVYNEVNEFDKNSQIVEFERPAVVLPKVEIWGDWDEWIEHELTPDANNLTASYTVDLTSVKDYQFSFIYNESTYYLPTVKITRAANAADCDGHTGNATIEADYAGEYTFTFTYATKAVTVTYPALPTGVFELYTGEIAEGKYLITSDGAAMNTTVSSNRLQYTNITPSDNSVTNPDASLVWTIAQSGDYWTLYNETEEAYAAATGSKGQAQMLADGTNDRAKWTITFANGVYEFENKARAAAQTDSDKKWLRRNGNYGFATYTNSTGTGITLYKKEGSGTSLSNTAVENKAVKFIENGQLIINLNGVLYNALGERIR